MRLFNSWLVVGCSLFAVVASSVASAQGVSPTAAGAARPHLMIQSGHQQTVRSVAFSPDDKQVLTACEDKVARLWDIESGREIREFRGDFGVSSVAFSPDGETVLTGNSDNAIRLWETKSGKLIRKIEAFIGNVPHVAYSPNGHQVLTSGYEDTAWLFDAKTGALAAKFDGARKEPVWAVAFSPDGKQILVGSDEKSATLWDVQTVKILHRFEGHASGITSVAFSPDGKQALTASFDKTARLWDVASGNEIRKFGKPPNITEVAFSPDGKQMLTTGLGPVRFDLENYVRLWDLASGKELRKFEGHTYAISAIAFSHDGKRIVSGGGDKTVRVWDAATGKQLQMFGQAQPVSALALSADEKQLLTGSENKAASLWDLAAGKVAQNIVGKGPVKAVAISTNGKELLVGGEDATRVYDAASGKPTREFHGHGVLDFPTSLRSLAVAFSPDGKLAATGSESGAMLFDNTTGTELRKLVGDEEWIYSVAFSADGNAVLTTGMTSPRVSLPAGTARLWDVKTGHEIRQFKGHEGQVLTAALSSDGKRLFTGSTGDARLWNAESGNGIQRFQDLGWVRAVALTPDAKQAVTASLDGLVRVWELAKGTELRRFDTHGGGVYSIALTRNRKRLFSANADGTVVLWDAATAKPLCSLASFPDGNWAVWDAEDNYDASNGGDIPELYWAVGDKPTEVAHLKEHHYQPGLLAKRMSQAATRAPTGGAEAAPVEPHFVSASENPAATPPTTQSGAATTGPAVTAEAFWVAYQKNGEAAKQKYGSNPIVVTGTIGKAFRDEGGAYLGLKSSEFNILHCELRDKNSEPWAEFAEEESVTLRGKVDVGSNGVFLTDCEVVEHGSNPAVVTTAVKIARQFLTGKKAMGKIYSKKPVILTGEVVQVDRAKEGFGRTLWLAGVGKMKIKCVCYDVAVLYEEEKKVIPKVGDTWTVVGNCVGVVSWDDEFSLFGCQTITKPLRPKLPADESKTPFRCTGGQISAAFGRDEDKALAKIGDKQVELTGQIAAIEPVADAPALTKVTMRVEDESAPPVVALFSAPADVAKLYVDQQVTLRAPLLIAGKDGVVLDIGGQLVSAPPMSPEQISRRKLIEGEPDVVAGMKGLGGKAWFDDNDKKERVGLAIDSGQLTDDGHIKPEILKQIRKLVRITNLDVDAPDAALLDLGELPHVDELTLGPEITDAGTTYLPAMKRLKRLVIKANLSAAGYAKFQGCTHITDLYISGELGNSKFTDDALKAFAGCTKMKMLMLEQLPIHGSGLACVRAMPQLQNAYLSGSTMTDSGLEFFAGAANLQSIVLEKTKITDDGLKHLHGCSKLQNVDLNGTQIIGSGLASLAGLKELYGLSLEDSQVADAGLANLHDLPDLRQLELSGSQVTGTGLAALQQLPGLEVLKLSKTAVGDAGLKALAGHKRIKELHLEHTKVTDAGLASLQSLPELEKLNLAGDNITDGGLPNLQKCPKLESLTLEKTKITDAGLEYIAANFQKLKNLSLYNVSGVTKPGVEKLKKALPKLDVFN